MEPVTKKKANSFGVFLDSVSQKDLYSGGVVVDGITQSSQLGEVKAETKILSLLAQSTAPLSVRMIIGQLDFAPSMVMTTLTQLATAKLVNMSSTTKDERVAITELGKKLTL